MIQHFPDILSYAVDLSKLKHTWLNSSNYENFDEVNRVSYASKQQGKAINDSVWYVHRDENQLNRS